LKNYLSTLKVAGSFLDHASAGGGFAKVRASSYDPFLLGVSDRPDINGSASGLSGLEGGFRIDQVELGRQAFPSNNDAVFIYFNPLYFRDFFQVFNAFL